MDTEAIKHKLHYTWRLVLLDFVTLLFVAGILSGQEHASAFVLGMILAGAAVEAIRRLSNRVITIPMLIADLVTMGFLATVVGNPWLWGIGMILTVLTAWVIVQGMRYFGGSSAGLLTALIQIALAVGTIVMFTRSDAASAVPFLLCWIAAEALWVLVDRRILPYTKRKRTPVME